MCVCVCVCVCLCVCHVHSFKKQQKLLHKIKTATLLHAIFIFFSKKKYPSKPLIHRQWAVDSKAHCLQLILLTAALTDSWMCAVCSCMAREPNLVNTSSTGIEHISSACQCQIMKVISIRSSQPQTACNFRSFAHTACFLAVAMTDVPGFGISL